tara:strand:+ start:118 stop:609 length:492 start_codon:yes stop_codon:yes gene_type:complete
MPSLITSLEIKAIITPIAAFDPSFFDTSIEYIEDSIISGILTTAYYNDLLAKVALLPGTPLSASDQLVYNIVLKAEAYAVGYESYQKDLESKANNQGIMTNHTQFSKSAASIAATRILKTLKDREYFYCYKLGEFLIANFANYPLVVVDDVFYEPNFRRFFAL